MNQARMPETYPERIRLNDELHARPPVALWPNEHILYLALVNPQRQAASGRSHYSGFVRLSGGGTSCPTLQGNNIEFDVAVNRDVCQATRWLALPCEIRTARRVFFVVVLSANRIDRAVSPPRILL